MGMFTRRNTTVAASAGSGTAAGTAVGALLTANYTAVGRQRAMRIPTVSRARDLICSMVAGLELEHYLVKWPAGGGEPAETRLQPDPWMVRPEQRVTASHTWAWLTDDLMFYGRAHLRVTARRQVDGRPYGFLRLPASQVLLEAEQYAGNVPLGPYQLTWNGQQLDSRDVISFWSPVQALLSTAALTLYLAERLNQTAARFASTPTAFGWLRQVAGEPMSGDELADLAEQWAQARDVDGAVGALNEFVEWHESTMSPDRLQLTASRQYASLELARLANCPPYLLGIDVSSMTYANAQQARQDLYLFGAMPYARCITETLSGDDVLPRDHYVRFNLDSLGTEAADLTNGAPAQ